MSLFFYVVSCMILLLFSFLYYKIRYPFVKLMNEIPGPYGVPLLGTVNYFYHTPRNKRMELIQSWFKSYGPIYRTWIGPECVVHIAKAEHAQKILSSMVNVEKCFQYTFAKLWLGNCVTLAPSEMWFERRNLLTPAFHVTLLNDFFDIMVKNCQILMTRLEKEADSEEFDIFPYINDCTVDVIAETAMNVKLNVQNGSSTEYPKNVQEFTNLIFKRFLNPLLYLPFMYALTNDYKKLMKVIRELQEVSSNVLKQRIAERKAKIPSTEDGETKSTDHPKHKTLLDHLLDLFDEGKYPIKIEEIREEIDDIMFAGFDPVKFAISMTIYLIGHHPEVQEKIHAELDSVIPFEDSPLNMQTIGELRYLESAMKECMRLYPPAPFIARSLKEAVVLDNYEIPVGTTVAIHFHAIHKSPEFYEHPDRFDPTHFSPEREKDLHPFAFIPFSAGPRNCMGHKFAKLEIKIALALFFKKYQVKSMTAIEDMSLFSEIIQKPEHGVFVKIKRRS